MSSKMLVWGSIALAVFSFFNAESILDLIYSQEVKYTIPSFQLLMITFVGMSISLIYGTLLTASGKLKLLNTIALIGLSVNILGNIIFIPSYGALGAAFTTLFTQFSVAGIQFFVVSKQFEIPVNRKQVLEFTAFLIVLIGGFYSTMEYHISMSIHLIFLVIVIFGFRIVNLKAFKDLLLIKNSSKH